MTKFFDETGKSNRHRKPTKLVKYLKNDMSVIEPALELKNWDKARLIFRGKLHGIPFDIILCYQDVVDSGCLYLGHWNDGCL